MAPCLGGERQVEELLGEPDEVAGRVGLFTGLAVAQEQGGAVDGIPNVDVGFTDQYFRPEVLRDPARFAVEVGVPVPAGDDADVADGRPLACQRWFLRGFTKLSSLFSFLALFSARFSRMVLPAFLAAPLLRDFQDIGFTPFFACVTQYHTYFYLLSQPRK
jgi:hypothetical protein